MSTQTARRYLAIILLSILIAHGVFAQIEKAIPMEKLMELMAGTDPTSLAMRGNDMTPGQIDLIEKQLEEDPDNLTSRTLVLGNLFFSELSTSGDARERHARHALWVIRNRPDAELAGLPFAQLDPRIAGKAYREGRKLWLGHVDRMSTNTSILGNAAAYFMISDKKKAEELLSRARDLEPDNPIWSEKLGLLYQLMGRPRESEETDTERAQKQFDKYRRALDHEDDPFMKPMLLKLLARSALDAGKDAEAERYAHELLEAAPD